MPVYEVEVGGTVYEVDAADPTAAAAAARKAASSNSPVTPDQPAEQQGQSAVGGKLRQFGDAAMTTINEGLNAATFGLTGMAERYLGGAAEMGLSKALGANPEMSYGDFVQAVEQQGQERRRDYPIAALGGTLAGAIAPAVMSGGASLGGAATNAMGGTLGRVAGAAGYGAAENMAIEAGRGSIDSLADMIAPGAIGAVGGAGGQVAGELLERGAGFIGSRFGNAAATKQGASRRLGKSLLEAKPGSGNIGIVMGGGTPEELAARYRDLASQTGGPSVTRFGETSPDMLRIMMGNAVDPETIGVQAGAQEMARQRLDEIGPQIQNVLADNLTDAGRSVSGREALQAARSAQEDSRAIFQEIFDSDAGRLAPVATKAQIKAAVADARDLAGHNVFDPATATPTERATLNRVLSAIDATGDADDLSMKALQKIKIDEVDRLLTSLRNPANSSQELSYRALSSVASTLNDTMAAANPAYDTARALYALPEEMTKFRGFGKDFIKGTNNTAPLPEVTESIKRMLPPERAAVQDGALEWLSGQINQSDATLKKLAQENPDLLGRIDAIFDTALASNATSLDDVVSTVDKLVEAKKLYRGIDNAITSNVSKAAQPATVSSMQDATDFARMTGATLSGHPASSAAMTSLRRLLGEDLGADSRMLADLLQAPNPTTANRMLDELIRSYSGPSVSMLGGLLGGAAGAGVNTIMDYR